MIDFINNYYYEDYSTVEGMDREGKEKGIFGCFATDYAGGIDPNAERLPPI